MKNENRLIMKRNIDYLPKKSWTSSKKRNELFGRLMTHSTLIIIGIAFFFPILWMILTALKSNDQIRAEVWLPNPPVFNNFPEAVQHIPFALYTYNTMLICVLCVIGTIVSCVLPAYGFARIKWPGREMFFMIMMATIMLPFQATMVPVYIIFRTMGWIGHPSFAPLWVPCFFGIPFFIFLLRQFFLGIPEELSDSARIDGRNEFGILARVMMPLSRPALITTGLFTFMWNWNDFLWPLVCINDTSMYTLSLALQQYLSAHGGEWGMLQAMALIVITPMIFTDFLRSKELH